MPTEGVGKAYAKQALPRGRLVEFIRKRAGGLPGVEVGFDLALDEVADARRATVACASFMNGEGGRRPSKSSKFDERVGELCMRTNPLCGDCCVLSATVLRRGPSACAGSRLVD
jgi:hypothetical protein